MLGNNHGSPYDHPSKVFRGVRFVILGFDPLNKAKVLKKLVDGGGVDAGHYGPNCTHVIVDNLAYGTAGQFSIWDDPICIVARSDGKTLVSGLWIDHSFDVGMPVDSTSVMYRPLKDLNGIPGAKSLIICLTGYQRQDRDDIMTMVGLMGANFSKPLVANKVTHLICYKFEGEKYELAKKIKRIKLVNHRWLEDCLKAWEIVPEADYDKSGYELETLEAEAKDSEDEANGYATKNYAERAASPHQPLVLKQEVLLNSSASKGFGKSMDMVSATAKITSDQAPNPHERQSKHPVSLGFCDTGSLRDVLCDPSYPYNKMEISAMSGNDFASTSEGTKKSPHSDAEKFSALSYLRNTPRRTTPSMYSGETASNLNSTTKLVKLNLGDGFHIASSVTEQATDGTGLVGFRTPSKGFALCPEEDQYGSFSAKRKMDISGGSSKLQKTIHNTKAHVLENPIVASGAKGSEHVFLKDGPVETINRPSPDNDASYSNEIAALNPAQNSPSNITARKSLSSNRKLLTCDTPISKTTTSESMQGENVEALQTSLKGFRTATLGTKPEIQNVGLRRPEHAMDEDQELRSDLQEVEIPSPSIKRLDIEKSNSSSILEINGGSGESHSKSVGRKMVGKKFLGPKLKLGNGKTANQKGSVYLKNSASRNNADQETADCDKFVNSETFDRVPSAANFDTEIEMEKNDVLHSKILAENKSVCMDDETEPPEDKEETVREKYQEIEQDNIVDMVTEEKSEGGLHQIDQNDEKGNGRAERESSACGEKNQMEKSANLENHVNVKKTKGKKRPSRKLKKDTTLSERDKVADIVTEEKSEAELHKTDQNDDKDIARTVYKSSACGDKNQVKSAIMEDLVSEKVARGKKRSSGKIKKNTVLSVSQPSDKKAVNKEEFASEQKNEKLEIKEPHSAGKTKTIATVNDLENTKEAEKENHLKKIIPKAGESVLDSMQGEFVSKTEPVWFILSGHRLQRKEFQKVIRGLKGRVCRDSHQWSYQATHLIVPDPIRRTEKFFAAAASGRWILKTDYLSASIQAGKFLAEEPYEWHKNGLTEDGAINLEAPRKWRLLKEKMGCGAFHGMKIIVYGECIAPPLDTLKRAVKAGDGTILATSPPYTRFLNSGVDFAVVSPGMPRVDMWVQEFLRHEIPCVVADYLVEYVCKTGYPLERHVQYSTHAWAEKSFMKLKDRLEEIVEPSTPENSNNNDIPCDVCGLGDRGDVMLICGDEIGSTGCGVGTHIDCCDLPLENVPEEDWFCPKCSKSKNSKTFQKGTKRKTSVGKRR